MIFDMFVRSRKSATNVIPAKAGIQTSSRRRPGTRQKDGCRGTGPMAFAGVTTSYDFITFAHL
jgi:hypothetical protein